VGWLQANWASAYWLPVVVFVARLSKLIEVILVYRGFRQKVHNDYDIEKRRISSAERIAKLKAERRTLPLSHSIRVLWISRALVV
jgi:hypothetical protein